MMKRKKADSLKSEIRPVTDSEVLACVVYTLAKLDYTKDEIEMVVREFRALFGNKCEARPIQTGREGRACLPTIARDRN